MPNMTVSRAAAELDEVARRGELGVQFRADGSAPLAPCAKGFAGALERLVAPVAPSGAVREQAS